MSRFPAWIRIKVPFSKELKMLEHLLSEYRLHTVCEEARCPNRVECFSRGTATFMILGDICTRNCRFCAVKKGRPLPVDEEEPKRVAEVVKILGLRYVVVTSVTRDDLPDGGALQFARVIEEVGRIAPDVKVEVLIPDFTGSLDALKVVIDAGPFVINHNVETVPRLYPNVRPMADYLRSLDVLRNVKKYAPNILTKSGIMVGLGERFDEVISVMKDLREVDCDMLTVGQYLKPTSYALDVVEFVHPEVFEEYRRRGEEMGFKKVFSAPLVRSSYHAEESMELV